MCGEGERLWKQDILTLYLHQAGDWGERRLEMAGTASLRGEEADSDSIMRSLPV